MMSSKYEMLSNRPLFNDIVRQVKATVEIAERVQSGDNLADVVQEMLEEKTLFDHQVLAVVSMLLADKFAYIAASRNLLSVETVLSSIVDAVKGWNAVDLVLVYHHPDLGVVCINPKNMQHMATLDRLNKYETVTVYAGNFGKSADAAIARKAVESLILLCEGKQPKIDAALLKGSCVYKAKGQKAEKAKKPAKAGPVAKVGAKTVAKAGSAKAKTEATAPQAPSAAAPVMVKAAPVTSGKRMTPMYAVPVSNELFHNGNVEAWKRIIDSYKAKHPDLEVLVYYDGERITNLNALFKWGKVKHGSTIQFAVAGENISDVAKLQRYLTQGASNMFEAFLRGPVNGVLSLF
ncbi:MAG: hypothetical protein KKI09_17230 [Spirochaetes bacterium]|nr:hypothetical protein [Spirochaetota bacterium]